MRTYLLSICLFLTFRSYSQTDSLPGTFFPHGVGDVWEYYDGVNTSRATLTRDSAVGNATFLYFNGEDVPAYSVDSSLDIIYYPTTPRWRSLLYKLNAKVAEKWVSDTLDSGVLIAARVDSVFWGSLFGVTTQIKAVGYYYAQYANDTIAFINWRNERYLGAGFGYFLSVYDAAPTITEQLAGCIIDGKGYGSLMGVGDVMLPHMPSSYRLYPAFPNPFNPSTTVSYTLPESGDVSVSVYDVLGRPITKLVDGFQTVGFHSILFVPRDLSSSIYFIRLTAHHFVATNKVIYSK
jgi:hypothetical protein